MVFNTVYKKHVIQTNFKINDIVSWTSHGSKGTTTKTGVIVAVVEPEENVNNSFDKWHEYLISSYGGPRAVRSYLIAVVFKPKCKLKLYFPFPNALKKGAKL